MSVQNGEINIEFLLQELDSLSPMPDDDSPGLTVERLKQYSEILDKLEPLIPDNIGSYKAPLIQALIHSFGYGDAYELYWSVIHLLERFPLELLHSQLREAIVVGERGARMWCVYMLGRQRNLDDLQVIISLLQDKEYRVQCNALLALSMLGDRSAQPAMERLLADPHPEVRRAAAENIAALLSVSK
jgi:HEAT repeat protein